MHVINYKKCTIQWKTYKHCICSLEFNFWRKSNCQKSWNHFLDMNWYNNSNSKNINIKRSNWFHRITTRKIRGNSIASICSLPALGKFLERFLHMKLIRIMSSNKCSYSFLSKRYITFPRWMHCMYIFIKLIVIIRWI